ncbi:beta-N-acetylhexosaminidase [Pseudopedobacter beijingensis]|uniref:Beta-N-acetylhexosaminidase n=1 Tax=Pseudopedobacter beijingensis TaxID=1207056 RepID=A0ABW4IA70_9SPHI
MKRFFGLLLLFIFTNVAYSQELLDLMPMPQKVERKEGKLYLDSNFRLSINGNPDVRLYKATTRFLRRLDEQTIVWFKQDQITSTVTDARAILNIEVSRPAKVVLKEDESYSIAISGGKIKVKATTDLGAMYALETLLQLVQADEKGFYFPNIEITDAPRFPWRGLMIDVVRHFIPYEVIIRNIDAMAAVKMNVLHLHLTDDQGFRIESKSFPKLHEKGSNGKYLTQEQIKDIINYASDRGIRVVPEFDMPGHASSWFPGYPEYASAQRIYEIETKYSHFEPAPTMDPTNENLYPFLDQFFKEMTALFPDEYIHIGGDENSGKQWDANPKIQEYKQRHNLKSNTELQTQFNHRLQDILSRYKKKMMGWDEILEPGISKDIMIHSWRGKKSLNEAAKKGYPVILSHGFYIDLLHSAQDYYLNDPLSESKDLAANELSNIYGGEAAMWTELATAETIDSRIWPSAAAIAERLWSAQEIRDVRDMYRRLDKLNNKLEFLGIAHKKNYEVMLKRLANGTDIVALKTLVDVVEPMKGLSRRKQGITYYTYTPLMMAADAARPDSKVAREFSYLIDDFVATSASHLADSIKRQYQIWIANHENLKNTMRLAPATRELEPVSENLKRLSEIGSGLVSYLQKKSKGKLKEKEKISETQLKEYGAFFKEAAKPRANVEFVVLIKATEKLLDLVQKDN